MKSNEILLNIFKNTDKMVNNSLTFDEKCEEIIKWLEFARKQVAIAQQEYSKEQKQETAQYICELASRLLDEELTEEDVDYVISIYNKQQAKEDNDVSLETLHERDEMILRGFLDDII